MSLVLVMEALLLLAVSGGTGTVQAAKRSARAVMKNAAGHNVGSVTLKGIRNKVEVTVRLRNQAPGFHGFHVHAVGQCVPPFTSAGGHFNPAGTTHGDHAGDMPSVLVSANGSVTMSFLTDRFTVQSLLDADGSAIIVHAGRDNFANIPTRYHSHTENTFGPDSATLATGDAGDRAACGVVA